MKTCPNCGGANADGEVICKWLKKNGEYCRYNFTLRKREEFNQGSNPNPVEDFRSTYKTARSIARFISVVGWLVIICGGLGLLIALASLTLTNAGMVAVVAGLSAMLSGLLLISAGQLTRASVDTADHTGAILAILKTTRGETPTLSLPTSVAAVGEKP
jgi:hypothetical protein